MLGQGWIHRALRISLVGVAAAACGDSPTGTSVAVTGVTVSATPNPAEVTATVQASAVVAPAGASQSVTWSSSDEAIATVNASGLVTLRLSGTVTITATSTADPTKSGSVTLTIVCPAPRLVTDNVREDTTWENWVPDPVCFDYVVPAEVHMNADVLTIEPGTVVGFEQGIAMRIRIGATLIAAGTAADPIVLTGTTKQRGFWKGLALETTHGDNVLTHVTVEYTGGAGISNTQDASLILGGNAGARIENSTFRESAGYGVFLDRDSRITGAGGSAFTGNALGPAWTYGTAVPNLNGAVLTGNDVDVVVVNPNAIMGVATWPSAVYHILRATNPQAFTVLGGELTLLPGTELRFEGDQSMLVMQGGLSAVGTAQAPIVLTGTQAVRGHWGGLGFIGSDHAMNRLEHVVVEYGGGRFIGGGVSERANVVVTIGGADEHSRVTIQNTTLRRSSEFGLWARAGSELTDFQGNTLTENVSGAAYVHAPVVDDLLASNTYGGNDNDEVVVETGVGMTITEAATWRDLGVPYHLRYVIGNVTELREALTIEPGVEMLMAPDLGIAIRAGGSLTAIGTETDRITIKARGAPWQGLYFADATGSFDYIDIEDGGSIQWGGVLAPGTVTITAHNAASIVYFTGEVTLSGVGFGIVFSHGNAIAVGCPGSVYIPPPDMVSDHCRPPT